MHAKAKFEFLRPFLWVAAFAFLTGFTGYFALGGAAALSADHQQAQAQASLVSGPASDEWNLPKEI